MPSSAQFDARGATRWAKRCEQFTDACLVLCLVAAPLWFGGRHDLGRLLYAGLVAAAALAWAARRLLTRDQRFAWSWLHTLGVAALGGVCLQVVPLGPATLHALSPALDGVAPAWTATSDYPLKLGEWTTLSITPGATRIGLAVLASHLMLLAVAADRLRDEADVYRMLRWIAIASVGMAAFGLLQWMTSNGKLLWFYAHPQREIGAVVQGSFANKNHFAHFVVLGLGPALLMLGRSSRRKPPAPRRRQATRTARTASGRPLGTLEPAAGWAAAVVVALAAVVLTASRGGVAAMAVSLAVVGVFALRAGAMRARHAAPIGLLAVAALGAVSLGDVHRVFGRLDDLASGSIEELDQRHGRREIWAANLAALRASPLLGYGVGSHADIAPAFLNRGFETEFTHAESGYLQVTTETGLAGAALLATTIALAASWAGRALVYEQEAGRLAAWAAVGSGLLVSATHSVVDFVWYLPACMSATVLLLACGLRLHQFRLARQSVVARKAPGTPAWGHWGPAAVVTVTAAVAVATLWRPGAASLAWDRYLRASGRHRDVVAAALANPDRSADSSASQIARLQDEMIAALRQTLRRHPKHPRARLRLAGRLLQQFELARRRSPNAIGLVHIREAALASNFPSRRETIDWLTKAFGDDARALVEAHRHTQTALALEPLQADGYGYLADLCFLSPPGQRDVPALVGQAVLARPYDGGTLFEAGKQAWVAGDASGAVDYWGRAHRVPGVHRLHIAAQLAGRVPAAEYLEAFTPGPRVLPTLYQHYLQAGRPADLEAIATYTADLAEQTEPGRRQASLWLMAARIELRLQNAPRAVELAERSLAGHASYYATRRLLAEAYLCCERADDAEPHLRWCLSRNPSDSAVQAWLKQTERRRLSAARRSSANR
ncbi:MAG: O-antigen ligase family protein [Planctomycetota bacterium]